MFNKTNLTFGFIFIKSSLLSKEIHILLENFWNKIISDTKGSSTKIEIQICGSQYIPEKIDNIVKMFINILSRNVKLQNFQISSYDLKKPIFQFSKEEELDYYSLQQIMDSLDFDYSSQKEIFYTISQIHHKKIKDEKLNTVFYLFVPPPPC